MREPALPPSVVRGLALAGLAGALAACLTVEEPAGPKSGSPAARAAALAPAPVPDPPLDWRGAVVGRERIAFVEPTRDGILLGLREVADDGTLADPATPPRLLHLDTDSLPSRSPPVPTAGLLRRAVALEVGRAAGSVRAVALVFPGAHGGGAARAVGEALADRGVALVVVEDRPEDLVAVRVRRIEDADREAPRLARELDARAVRRARAALGVLSHLEGRRRLPDDGPVLLVADGLGVAPALACATRLAARVRAAAFVAGGADLFRVAAAGGLPGVVFDPPIDRWDARTVDWFESLYLAEARFDPIATASALAASDVLLVEARFDGVVGDRAVWALYDALGRPERWRVLGGHEAAVEEALDRREEIARWLLRRLDAPAPSAAGAKNGPPERRRAPSARERRGADFPRGRRLTPAG